MPSIVGQLTTGDRPPRLLWANAFCLLDTTSGASLSAREMLKQLQAAGVETKVLGATIFDHPSGAHSLGERLATWQRRPGKSVTVRDGDLTHELITTATTARDMLTSREADAWWVVYQALLDDFRPDVIWGYGGLNLEMLASAEARSRRIPYLAYLVNGNYTNTRWVRDVHHVITDSQVTSEYYRQTLPCPITPVGTFISPKHIVPREHRRERLLFVNPLWSKGAGIVAQLAILMGKIRPDIPFEVVESRGQWSEVVKAVSMTMGEEHDVLPNVVVTPHTRDMASVYGRTRLLLAPSLWWESGARVLAEAMLNGIPAVITQHGGSSEMIGDGGIRLNLPEACHDTPYTQLPRDDLHAPLIHWLIQLYDDEAAYQRLVQRAYQAARERHDMSRNVQRLLAVLGPLFNAHAGDHAFLPTPVAQIKPKAE